MSLGITKDQMNQLKIEALENQVIRSRSEIQQLRAGIKQAIECFEGTGLDKENRHPVLKTSMITHGLNDLVVQSLKILEAL